MHLRAGSPGTWSPSEESALQREPLVTLWLGKFSAASRRVELSVKAGRVSGASQQASQISAFVETESQLAIFRPLNYADLR